VISGNLQADAGDGVGEWIGFGRLKIGAKLRNADDLVGRVKEKLQLSD
jgi:hypothetical protein